MRAEAADPGWLCYPDVFHLLGRLREEVLEQQISRPRHDALRALAHLLG
jgi:hypothetical protein